MVFFATKGNRKLKAFRVTIAFVTLCKMLTSTHLIAKMQSVLPFPRSLQPCFDATQYSSHAYFCAEVLHHL